VIDLFTRPFDQAWLDVRTRLQSKNLPAQEVERLHDAWTKAVILSLTLWSRPYTKADLW